MTALRASHSFFVWRVPDLTVGAIRFPRLRLDFRAFGAKAGGQILGRGFGNRLKGHLRSNTSWVVATSMLGNWGNARIALPTRNCRKSAFCSLGR